MIHVLFLIPRLAVLWCCVRARAELHYCSDKAGKNKKIYLFSHKMIINGQVSKAWNAFLQARANVLHSARDFLPLGLIFYFLVFYHVIRQSAVIKRALIGYDEEIYYRTSIRESKH